MARHSIDTRYLDGKQALLFGPFATFSTKFLKQGSYFDLPASVTIDNFRPMVAVGWDDFALVEYLAGQLIMSDADRMEALRQADALRARMMAPPAPPAINVTSSPRPEPPAPTPLPPAT